MRNGCLLLLDFAMLVEKLIEQHRVHRFVAHCVDFAMFVAHHQVWVAAVGVAPKRIRAHSSVCNSGGEAKKGVLALRRVEPG